MQNSVGGGVERDFHACPNRFVRVQQGRGVGFHARPAQVGPREDGEGETCCSLFFVLAVTCLRLRASAPNEHALTNDKQSTPLFLGG